MYTLIALSVYILLLFAVSRLAQRGSNEKTFFDGGRRSPWYVVAFGMIGASISGVSFVSVPGMVGASGFTYMQMVLGFAVGYVVIAYLLLPVYYRQNKVSIYAFLEKRFGVRTHKTASCLFILSKSVVASARLYVAAIVLKIFVFDKLTEHETPFAVIVFAMMALIFLYTFRSGIKALVWTDFFQTFTLLFALCSIVAVVCSHLGIDNIRMLAERVQHDPHTQFFVWNDWKDSRQRHLYHRCNDGTRPRHDAEKPDLQDLTAVATQHAYLRHDVHSCKSHSAHTRRSAAAICASEPSCAAKQP